MEKFDLSVFDTRTKANEGVEIDIKKPDGDSSGLFIKVLGSDGDTYTKLRERHERARVRALSKGGRGALDGLYDQAKQNDLDLVVSCTMGWRHESGEAMPFDIGADPDQARGFYELYPRVFDQVRNAIIDPANFTKAPE